MIKALAAAPQDTKVLFFAYSNLLFERLFGWVGELAPLMHFLTWASQVGVAVATIFYIVKKTRGLPSRHPSKKQRCEPSSQS